MKVSLSGRRTRATERQTLANGRTPEQQLAELDLRLGVGVGAKKERARLATLIAKPKTKSKKA